MPVARPATSRIRLSPSRLTITDELIRRTRNLGIHLWVADGMLNFRAPRAAISAELRSELLAHKASIIDALSGPLYQRGPEVGAIDIPEAFATAWNHFRAGAIGVGYANVTNLLCRFRCPIDLQALERSLHCLVRQHDALRCRLVENNPGLRLAFDCNPTLTMVDLSDCNSSEIEYAITKAAQKIVWPPFASGECLFRPFVLKLPSSQTAIGFVVQHFIVDSWSFGQIPAYWMAEYQKQLSQPPGDENPHVCLQYSDFLLGVTNWSKTLNFQRRLDYWKEVLRGVVPSRLPPDRAVDNDTTSLHRDEPVHIDADRVRQLAEMAASLGVTLSDVLLAGVALALHRELAITDICLRHVGHGRDAPALFDMIGFTLNKIILRVRLNPESQLRDVAQQVHRVAQEAHANQVPCYYVDKLLNETSTTAFVETNFQLMEDAGDHQARENAAVLPPVEPIPVWNPDRAFATPRVLQAHDINLRIANGAVSGQISYLEGVYDAETIRRFVHRFTQALSG